MKAVGIICEYIPFHNGHLYHLEQVQKRYPNHSIVLILSGNFTQRGIASVLTKWDKTKLALSFGVNLVVELPFVFATQSADIFARGSISLLKELKVEALVFGSECDDVKKLETLADIQLENKDYDTLVQKYLDQGLNYPTAMSHALKKVSNDTITMPNDLLGLSYIKEIKRQKAHITPVTTKRIGSFHSEALTGDIASAKAIRAAQKANQNISPFVPKETLHDLNDTDLDMDRYYPFLQYKIMTDPNLDQYQTVDEGLAARMKHEVLKHDDLESFVQSVKTKRYTYNKIMRMLTHVLCSFTKEEANKYTNISYIRILGMDSTGREYLNSIKKELNLPCITAWNQIENKTLEIEYRSTIAYLFGLSPVKRKELINKEFDKKPILKK